MKELSRRNFLKGAAAFGLASAMPSMVSAASAGEASADDAYTFADTIRWDAQYDVAVLGMGFAGMVAAKTAADNGARVVIIEKMPEAEAGGNSKVCGQMFAWGHGNVEKTKAYYRALAGGREMDDAVLDVIAENVANMADTMSGTFGMNPDDFWVLNEAGALSYMSPEYPEKEGSDSMSLVATHHATSDSYLYRNIKALIYSMGDKIDIWYASPAQQLIQEPETKTIIGVRVTRNGQEMNVRALNGVCVCTGGFEDNKQMVQDYLGLTYYAARGGLYNTGDGIRMALEAGADLWHMNAYEGFFGLGGVSWDVGEGAHASWISTLTQNANNTGATMLVGTDGERFLNESEIVRHGHLYENGIWENPVFPEKIWYIFDETQKKEMEAADLLPEQYKDQIMAFDSIEAMAEGTGCVAERLERTIEEFNSFAVNGRDYKTGRDTQFMRPFDGEKYYAVRMRAGILNTQGGPRRSANAEIVGLDGKAIPHLYSAGEMGGVTVCMYQGGTNVAECFTFGQIAGRNAAAPKEPLPVYAAAERVESNPAMPGEITDMQELVVEVEAADNQFVGTGTGINGDVVVRVTKDLNTNTITNVEVVSHSETPDIGGLAIESLTSEFIGLDANAAAINAVDSVSGATVTTGAMKEAILKALSLAE